MRNFTSQAGTAGQEQDELPVEEYESFDFGLDGVTFTCMLRTDADALIEWSEFAAAVLDSDIDSESPEGVALTSKLLRLAMPNGEYRRFRAHLRQHKTKPDVLIQVLQCINEEMQAAVTRRTARPTVRRSPSSGGRGDRDARVARVISLQDGDVTTVPAPQDHLPRRDGKPNGGGRKTRQAKTATAG